MQLPISLQSKRNKFNAQEIRQEIVRRRVESMTAGGRRSLSSVVVESVMRALALQLFRSSCAPCTVDYCTPCREQTGRQCRQERPPQHNTRHWCLSLAVTIAEPVAAEEGSPIQVRFSRITALTSCNLDQNKSHSISLLLFVIIGLNILCI